MPHEMEHGDRLRAGEQSCEGNQQPSDYATRIHTMPNGLRFTWAAKRSGAASGVSAC